MSLGAPKVNPPAPQPAPVDQGADALKLGSDTVNTRTGNVGRLALRVGSASSSTGMGS